MAQWLSDHWPAGATWPADIPRPRPTPPPEPQAPPVDDPAAILRTVRAASDRALAAAGVGNLEAWERDDALALRVAATLRDDGTVACPAALCAALRVPRHVYDDAVRRYVGRPDRQPRRPKSPTGRMVAALRAAGDRRFVRLEPKEAA